jgi:arsenate reductase (thioredoxin)
MRIREVEGPFVFGLELKMKKRVLILCTGNSARSQMAEGMLRHLAGDRFEVFSAGTYPSSLNPNAISALADLGIDISHHRSKSVDEFSTQSFDYIITVCDNARESCPIFSGTGQRIHHNFVDPAAAPTCNQPTVFRQVRDSIRTWLETFIAEHS